ncbi:MAG: 2-oxoglutarate dehydrogenase complex dihydrolipoyllysine-residue succinyltransferase [Phycisphaerales bacterium JB065]
MPTDIVIPALGESISEAVIATWLKEDGDFVEQDEDLVELETDKVTMPLPSPASGVLKRSVSEGDTVEVGATIGTLDESAQKPAGGDAKKPDAAPASKPEPAKAEAPKQDTGASKPQSLPEKPVPVAPASGGTSPDNASAFATAVARKIADEHKIDLATVRPTGAGGRIREQDVLAALHASQNGTTKSVAALGAAAPQPAMSRATRREKMSPLRKSIANRLVEAQHTAAMLTTFNECDMTNVMTLRSRLKDQFLEKHGVKLGFMSFFTKACVSALKKVPNVNAQIVQGEKGPEVLYHDYADIAIAVGTPKGLVVPVLRNAESLSFAGIESGILELAKKARDGKLTLEEMQNGTFTITNGGIYGSMMSTPILNAPQSGILGMHNIIKRPVENPDKPGEIALRPMMYIALSYDHRIVDGEGAVTFLKHVKDCIEDPERLLLEV